MQEPRSIIENSFLNDKVLLPAKASIQDAYFYALNVYHFGWGTLIKVQEKCDGG